jgi:TonB family protein
MYAITLALLLSSSSIEYGVKGCEDQSIEFLNEFQTTIEYLGDTPTLFNENTFKLRGFLLAACARINAKVEVEFDISPNGKIENYKVIESTPKRIADKEVKRALYRAELLKSSFGTVQNKVVVHYFQFKKKT